MPDHALELTLDPTDDALVRAWWAALPDAGLPSQARHRGPTNAPHVTVAAAPAIAPEAARAAAAGLAALLPLRVPLAGHVVFGLGPVTLAALLAAPPALVDAAARAAHLVGDPRAGGWVPHLTLARRLRAEQLETALTALAACRHEDAPPPAEVTLTGIRHWDPTTGTTHDLTTPGAREALGE